MSKEGKFMVVEIEQNFGEHCEPPELGTIVTVLPLGHYGEEDLDLNPLDPTKGRKFKWDGCYMCMEMTKLSLPIQKMIVALMRLAGSPIRIDWNDH